ncbi:PQQ-dependent sugar dehydrogenase [Streptomyces sp. 8K308]|uniref:PQQ-dependent sugar dehydrogenase n=1 Tax=Streptomyces sp. 8K308 TaxID=2530388 RepID=UPI001049CF03|nr:PQQ-dependent sugar dehydrogenase [Streptomyces sp. 8K308]TDC20981.1 PQQ-dependent sugar dehydrogenase [Streptomyces sp. 8K308]
MRGRTRARVVVAALAVAALCGGCAFGPAANRAEQVGTSQDLPEEPPAPDGETPPPSEEPRTEPPVVAEPAPATGTAEIAGTVAEGLPDACCAVTLPDGGLLVGEAGSGTIHRVAPDGTVTEAGTAPGVSGLLGLAVEPGFTGEDGWVYLSYATDSGTRVARYPYDGGRLGSASHRLLEDIPAGGVLAFGPDGMLYVGTSDAGQPGLATDPQSSGGKILRIEPDGGVPVDNPLQGSPVYASGHTDVAGLAWDAAGRLWSLDATTDDGVELNSIAPGGGYEDGGLAPVYTWPAGDAAPRGLAFSAGSLWAPDTAQPRLWRVPLNGTELTAEPAPLLAGGELSRPQAVVPAVGGPGLGVLDGADGSVLRIDIT